jgi:23S rRNA pseudouridine1911/1915/1917 synthase
VSEHDDFSFVCGEAEGAGERLDKFLSSRLGDVSRSRIQVWIEAGHIRVNGQAAHKNAVLRPGDRIEADIPDESAPLAVVPEDIPLRVVYEDAAVAVVDKPKGMVTHPGHGVRTGTLANALAYRFSGGLSDLGGSDRPGIVHRLDRDTSGLLVVARSNAAHAALSRQLAERRMRRTYQAICWREPATREGTFSWPLGRHATDPLRRAVRPDGKLAVTHYRITEYFQFAASAVIRLETGRTHQIRVHFAQAGHPVAGDPVYGGREAMTSRLALLYQQPGAGLLKRLSSQALHAAKIAFVHPVHEKELAFDSSLPPEFRAALEFLEPYRRREEA